MSNTRETNEHKHPLRDRILGLLEQERAERRGVKVFVELPGEGSGPYREKEIGELCISERRSLPPDLRENIAEQLLDPHLARQGDVDLTDKKRVYRKKIEDLSPADLPALVEADRLRPEEQGRKDHERAGLTRDMRADLAWLGVLGLAEMSAAGKVVRR